MRELTKSALNLSWGLSLFGAKQARDFFSPAHMDDNLEHIYRAGEKMQSQTVDAALSLLDPRNWFKEETWNSFGSLLVPFSGQKKASSQTEEQDSQTTPSPGTGTSSSPAAPAGNTRESSGAPGWGPMPTKKL